MASSSDKDQIDIKTGPLVNRRRVAQLATMIAGTALAPHTATAAVNPSDKNATIETINQFLTAYWSMNVTATLTLAAEDFKWVNMPMPNAPQFTVNGRDSLQTLMTKYNGGFPEKIDAGDWRFVYALADGDTALHERVDRFKIRGKWVEVPCNAHWQVRDGKVVLWRDYYDMQTYVNGLASVGIKINPWSESTSTNQ